MSIVDMSVALGKGIYSVGQDIVYGVQRTGEGLGLGEDGRAAQIGHENSAMVGLIGDILEYGVNNRKSPLFKSIVIILEHYYMTLSDDDIKAISKQAGIAASYTAGRMVIGKKLAELIAVKIAVSIASSAAYKMIAQKLGVSAGASATGIGIPIGLFMFQGLLQRSSIAANKLKSNNNQLYQSLKMAGDLHLVYFLLEKAMEKHVAAISKFYSLK